MIMQESSCVDTNSTYFSFYKTQNFSLQMSKKYNIWGSRSTKIQNFPELRPGPVGGGGGGGLQPTPPPHPNPPGVSSLASLGRKDTSLRSNLPPPPTQQRWLRGWCMVKQIQSLRLSLGIHHLICCSELKGRRPFWLLNPRLFCLLRFSSLEMRRSRRRWL